MGSTKNKSKIKIQENVTKYCNQCNPKQYLKFNFSFCNENGKPAREDISSLFKKLKFLSKDRYKTMMITYQGDKKKFIESISTNNLKLNIPIEFRQIYPTETNEKYSIFRIYPAGIPKGTANPRVIGIIKNTIFYVFYIDWKGDMYSHGR